MNDVERIRDYETDEYLACNWMGWQVSPSDWSDFRDANGCDRGDPVIAPWSPSMNIEHLAEVEAKLSPDQLQTYCLALLIRAGGVRDIGDVFSISFKQILALHSMTTLTKAKVLAGLVRENHWMNKDTAF